MTVAEVDTKPLLEVRGLTGCGKSRDFGKSVMKRVRNGNPGLIKSTGYEGAKGDELGWKHHRPTFFRSLLGMWSARHRMPAHLFSVSGDYILGDTQMI